MDFSQIPPEMLQQLMQITGARSPDELVQLAQANPQIAQQLLSGSALPPTQDAAWIEQAADQQAAPGARSLFSPRSGPTMSESIPPLSPNWRGPRLYNDPKKRTIYPYMREEEADRVRREMDAEGAADATR